MKWYSSKELPPKDEDSVDDSVAVLVTFDGKKISTLAVYDYKIKRWFALAGGDYRIMDKPLKWAYPDVIE